MPELEDPVEESSQNIFLHRTFLLHKPLGVVSSRVDSKVTSKITRKSNPLVGQEIGGIPRKTVYDLAVENGFPDDCGLVGRLDVETSGIILFTDDSTLLTSICHPAPMGSKLAESAFKQKEYLIDLLCLEKIHSADEFDIPQLEKEFIEPFTFSRQGKDYSTNSCAQAFVTKIWQDSVHGYGQPLLGWIIQMKVVLNEGKHHQIRRMAHRQHYRVLKLVRTKIAHVLSIDSVPLPGQCRWLNTSELLQLYEGLEMNGPPRKPLP